MFVPFTFRSRNHWVKYSDASIVLGSSDGRRNGRLRIDAEYKNKVFSCCSITCKIEEHRNHYLKKFTASVRDVARYNDLLMLTISHLTVEQIKKVPAELAELLRKSDFAFESMGVVEAPRGHSHLHLLFHITNLGSAVPDDVVENVVFSAVDEVLNEVGRSKHLTMNITRLGVNSADYPFFPKKKKDKNLKQHLGLNNGRLYFYLSGKFFPDTMKKSIIREKWVNKVFRILETAGFADEVGLSDFAVDVARVVKTEEQLNQLLNFANAFPELKQRFLEVLNALRLKPVPVWETHNYALRTFRTLLFRSDFAGRNKSPP